MAYNTQQSVGECEIGQIVRKAEQDYRLGQTVISKYVNFNMRDTLDKIDAYHYSVHTSGSTDSLGRDKPFFNIVSASENIWYRATDIDRGQIKIKAKKSKDVVNAFLKTIHVQSWMNKENFGIFLNDWGRHLSRYGSSIVKFVEKEGELHRKVMSWQSMIVDSIDFDNNPKIEIIELTEAQLYKIKEYDQDLVEKLCEAKSARKTIDGQRKDNKNDYIRLYEVHGELPLSYLTGEEKDEDTYVQQMHVISFLAGKDEGTFDDYTLYSGKEEKDPYMITHLIREDDRTLGIGPVEKLFDAQWMLNHSVKAIKDQLDLASKLIFQTSDGSFVGQNALTAIENGDILIHKPNEPLTQLQNNSHDITSLQSFGQQWKVLGNELTGVSESMLGNNAPAGTAWRQVEALLNESHDLFDLMRQNKGLYIEEMFKKYVIPYVNKQMDTSEEISATLESYDIEKIDSKYIDTTTTNIVNKAIKDKVLYGNPNDITPVTPEEQAMLTQDIAGRLKKGLQDQGNQRFFTPDEVDTVTWKQTFKDSDDEVSVDVTGEDIDKDAMTTLNTMLGMIAKNPGILNDPNVKMLWDKILMLSGSVSPLEISSQPSPLQLSSIPSAVPVPAGMAPQQPAPAVGG